MTSASGVTKPWASGTPPARRMAAARGMAQVCSNISTPEGLARLQIRHHLAQALGVQPQRGGRSGHSPLDGCRSHIPGCRLGHTQQLAEHAAEFRRLLFAQVIQLDRVMLPLAL